MIHLRNFQDQRGALLIAVIGAVVNKVKMAIISSCIKLQKLTRDIYRGVRHLSRHVYIV